MDKQNEPREPVSRENKMGTMPMGRLLRSMAIPMMISMLVQALYNVVDSMFVAKISQDAFNAVSLAFPLQNLMISVGIGTAVGINALLSRSLGERKQRTADLAANTGIFLALCNAVVFALGGLLLARPFFLSQTQNMVIVDYGIQYAHICLGLSIGLFCQFCFERLLQSTGRTALSMTTQLVGAVLNIILDPILIFGLFGLPAMGVAGAAAATVIGQITAAVFGLYLNSRHNPDIHLRPADVRPHGAIIREVYRVGVPTIIMQSIGSVMIFGMNKILITFTEAATAVFGAYFKLQSFIFMPVFGLNNAMVPIVAYNYGAARPDRVRHAIRLTICTAVAIMLTGMAAFQLFPGQLLDIFSASAEMRAIGVVALRIISVTFPLAGVCIISCSVCQAIGNPLHSLIASAARQLVVLLPAAWLLSLTGVLQLVWFSFVIAEVVSLALCVVFLRRTMHKVALLEQRT